MTYAEGLWYNPKHYRHHKEVRMPYINVKVAGSLSKEQKEEIAKGFCDVMEKVAHKKKESVYIVFDEVDRKNWTVGDKLLG